MEGGLGPNRLAAYSFVQVPARWLAWGRSAGSELDPEFEHWSHKSLEGSQTLQVGSVLRHLDRRKDQLLSAAPRGFRVQFLNRVLYSQVWEDCPGPPPAPRATSTGVHSPGTGPWFTLTNLAERLLLRSGKLPPAGAPAHRTPPRPCRPTVGPGPALRPYRTRVLLPQDD